MKEEIQATIKLLKDSLDNHIQSFEKKIVYNRNKTKFQHGFIIFTGALIAVLSGINIDCVNIVCIESFTRLIVLILGAGVTIMEGYKAFFNNKDLWVKFTMAVNRLKKVRAKFKYRLSREGDKISIEELDDFKDKIQEILDETNDNWESIRSK